MWCWRSGPARGTTCTSPGRTASWTGCAASSADGRHRAEETDDLHQATGAVDLDDVGADERDVTGRRTHQPLVAGVAVVRVDRARALEAVTGVVRLHDVAEPGDAVEALALDGRIDELAVGRPDLLHHLRPTGGIGF